MLHEVVLGLNLDPAASCLGSESLLGEIYSGLVAIGAGSDGDVVPELASNWTISGDGREYTFTIRADARFSDGSTLSAEDVKWSWERALAPSHVTDQSRYALGGIHGAVELANGRSLYLEGVKVIDDSTLSVKLSRANPLFLLTLADSVASVMSRENVQRWDTTNWVDYCRHRTFGDDAELEFRELPIGTGPFKVVGHDHPYDVVLAPNSHYWGGEPRGLSNIVYRNLHESFAGTQPFRVPSLAEFDSIEAPEAWARSITDGDPIVSQGESVVIFEPLKAHRAPEVTLLALNSAVEPFDDVNFRQALQFATDRYPLAGSFVVDNPRWSAGGLLPPGFPGHSAPDWEDVDRNSALAAIDRSRHASPLGGIILRPLILEGEPYPGFIRSLTRNWVDWFDFEIDEWDGEFLPRDEFNAELESGTLQMRYVHVKPRYPDPCAILCRIPDLFGPNAQSDETREVREMLDDAAATADRAARIAKYQAIEEHVLDRALVVPIAWDDGTELLEVKPYISGYRLPAYGGSMYEDVVVDTTHPDYPQERLSDGWAR